MAEEDSFLALVHSDGEIKRRSREGVKFTDKNPTNVFITTRTRLVDLQRSIQRRICRDGRKHLGMICYRISISIVAQGVKYGCFAIEADEDLQVLFYCRRQFLEMRTTELFVEMLDPLASSSGSALNPYYAIVGLPSRPVIQHDPEAHQVSSPTFGIYHEAKTADNIGDLGDTRSFEEIAAAVAAAPYTVPVLLVERDPEPLVDEALRADDFDDEPAFFEGDGDSDDDIGPVPTQQGGAYSSGTQQYLPHLSNLDLDGLSGPGIRRGVEYKVMEPDHAKYLGQCKADAFVSIKVLRTATESTYDFLPSYRKTWKAK
ncbi:hypothetical protein PIB30_057469 [Stylosanthes scabra]|uniref:Uncharacterized protein n=1 Tax=Stylosanthes scabra TaxID=79078 RepID=A0ABU6QJ62_9FABA|nr:hypothetical protein [Stylosanthes scabra]